MKTPDWEKETHKQPEKKGTKSILRINGVNREQWKWVNFPESYYPGSADGTSGEITIQTDITSLYGGWDEAFVWNR